LVFGLSSLHLLTGQVIPSQTLPGLVFENVEVHYRGGPVILKGVVFINCKFVFDNDERGRSLADAILSSSSEVEFTA
jgi:hypothetical protein